MIEPLVVIEQLRGGVLLFPQEHELRVEKELAFFGKVKSSKQTPPLSDFCEGRSCPNVPVVGLWGGPLFPPRAAWYLPPHQATRAASAHSALVG